MTNEEILTELNIDNTNKYAIIKDARFKNLGDNLNYYDPKVVNLNSFEGENGNVRYFWFNHSSDWKENSHFNKKISKPSSRSQMFSNREPFSIEPWNQILIDEAAKYGSKVDDNIEDFYNGKTDNLLVETEMSIDNILSNKLVWVGRSIMVCHPNGYVYGEIDELLYSPETDTYYVGDTKTSSSVYKASYGYQLAVYIHILRLLNPDKKFSSIGKINWVKVKSEKWKFDRQWDQKYQMNNGAMPPKVVSKDEIKDHPVYRAKWNGKTPLPKPELTKKIVDIDVQQLGLDKIVEADLYLIYNMLPKYGFYGHASALPDAVAQNEHIKKWNDAVQQKYNQIKETMEK